MFRRAHLILLLAFCMLCVPALTRVTQQLEQVTSATQPSGFSRNCDAPPERTTGSPLLILASLPSTLVSLEELAPSVVAVPVHAPGDDTLPAPVEVSRPDSLRAPPSRLA
jgi:hypothetical protein